jgi:hypothetical protein
MDEYTILISVLLVVVVLVILIASNGTIPLRAFAGPKSRT